LAKKTQGIPSFGDCPSGFVFSSGASWSAPRLGEIASTTGFIDRWRPSDWWCVAFCCAAVPPLPHRTRVEGFARPGAFPGPFQQRAFADEPTGLSSEVRHCRGVWRLLSGRWGGGSLAPRVSLCGSFCSRFAALLRSSLTSFVALVLLSIAPLLAASGPAQPCSRRAP